MVNVLSAGPQLSYVTLGGTILVYMLHRPSPPAVAGQSRQSEYVFVV